MEMFQEFLFNDQSSTLTSSAGPHNFYSANEPGTMNRPGLPADHVLLEVKVNIITM